jgi:glycosyltransferase involved in cell wall biosynthesis
LFLARLVREKGITETLVAVAALRDRGWPITLTIAGEGEAIGDVRRLVAFYDAKGEFLRLAGDVRGRDKATTFAYHDIYCLPTYGEGMPNAVLEAMACGMPVVTCPVGGLCDFFEDGKMGLFVEPRSPGAIAIALERLIADPGLRQRIGAYNAEYAASFLAPAVAKRLAAIYRAHA